MHNVCADSLRIFYLLAPFRWSVYLEYLIRHSLVYSVVLRLSAGEAPFFYAVI